MGHGGRVNDGNGGERVGRGAEESGADPGEGRGRRGGREGERGEWEGGPRKRGPLAPLSSRGVHRRRGGAAAARPCSDRVGGTGKGEGGGGLGRGRGGAAQFGPGGGAVGGKAGPFPPFFLFLCLGSVFCFLFICLFPFLFYFI